MTSIIGCGPVFALKLQVFDCSSRYQKFDIHKISLVDPNMRTKVLGGMELDIHYFMELSQEVEKVNLVEISEKKDSSKIGIKSSEYEVSRWRILFCL